MNRPICWNFIKIFSVLNIRKGNVNSIFNMSSIPFFLSTHININFLLCIIVLIYCFGFFSDDLYLVLLSWDDIQDVNIKVRKNKIKNRFHINLFYKAFLLYKFFIKYKFFNYKFDFYYKNSYNLQKIWLLSWKTKSFSVKIVGGKSLNIQRVLREIIAHFACVLFIWIGIFHEIAHLIVMGSCFLLALIIKKTNEIWFVTAARSVERKFLIKLLLMMILFHLWEN